MANSNVNQKYTFLDKNNELHGALHVQLQVHCYIKHESQGKAGHYNNKAADVSYNTKLGSISESRK